MPGTERGLGGAGLGGAGLEVADVTVRLGGATVVESASLAVEPGQVLAVLGPSGCGKSTLLRAIAGLEPIAAGRVRFGGADLAGIPTHKRGFALMFQDGQLFDHLSAGANVAYPLRLRRRPRAETEARVAELLELVGLSGYADRAPATLSGGERQRVALARALAVSPRLLLLDEPLSALDTGLRERLAAELRQIIVAAGLPAIFVTHDHEEAFAVADAMAVMRAGRLVQQGPIGEVWQHPIDAETAVFLGYARVLTGAPARAVLASAGAVVTGEPAVALRRSALRVLTAGEGEAVRRLALRGTVISARATPEQVRLVVEVPGVGEVDAVAPAREKGVADQAAVGAVVELTADPSRLAIVGGPGGSKRPTFTSLD